MEENMKYKADWMNPESPNYYKGFRYEMDEVGDEFWYDDKNILRKEIRSFFNGNKMFESFFNEKSQYHNEDGYAYIGWDINNKISFHQYYLNGKQLTEDEWKEEIGKNKQKYIDFANWILTKEYHICETASGIVWKESMIGGKSYNSDEIVGMYLNEMK